MKSQHISKSKTIDTYFFSKQSLPICLDDAANDFWMIAVIKIPTETLNSFIRQKQVILEY